MKKIFEPLFKREDFWAATCNATAAEKASEIANAKIEKLIESWEVVYLDKHDNLTWIDEVGTIKKARLAFIEPIEKEPCKHEPAEQEFLTVGVLSGQRITLGREELTKLFSSYRKCKHCGVELVAEWKPK